MESLDELREETKILADNNIDTDELVRITEAIEREVEEKYVLLPKDANGEHIHIGDKLVGFSLEGGSVFECTRLVLTDDWLVCRGMGIGTANSFVHYKPPTVENVLEKALNKAASLDRPEGYWPSAADITNILNEVAPKLQLREED